MKIRVVNGAAVRELLPMERCIHLMRDAMTLAARGKAVQPIRQAVRQPDGRGLLGLMPGHMSAPDWLGVKVVSIFDGNSGTSLGSHQGMVLLFETGNGRPRAIIDARELTAIRTAAATAVATDLLAPSQASSLAIFGYGEQARRHLEAIAMVRDLRRILVWGRDQQKARAFCMKQSAARGRSVEAAERPELAAHADIVCTVTASAEPIYRGAWLRPGQHLNLVGSSVPTTSEVDTEVVRRSRYFVDLKENALALAGELRRAKAAGIVGDEHIVGCIGDVLERRVPGRLAATDITLFKSLGMIAEDLLAANQVLAEAERLDAGQLVDW